MIRESSTKSRSSINNLMEGDDLLADDQFFDVKSKPPKAKNDRPKGGEDFIEESLEREIESYIC